MLSIGLALGSAALADGAARVVLVGPSASDPTVVRLRRELRILGIEVELVPTDGAGRRLLADVAREHDAPAGVAWEPSPPAVVLWIDTARYPNGTAGAEIRIDEGLAGSAEPRLLVLRAVEILRERLLPAPARPPAAAEAGLDGSPPADTFASRTAPAIDPAAACVPGSACALPPTPPRAALPRVPSERGPSVFAGPAVLASPGGVGATPHVWLGARWAPASRVDLELLAFLPTTAASVYAPEGSMTLRSGAFGAGASVRLTEPASSLFITAGAGLAAMVAAFEGQARPPWVSAGGLRWAMLPYLHAGVGYWLVPRVALRADVMTGFALPEPVLSIAGRKVAFFGEPAVLFAAGIEVRP